MTPYQRAKKVHILLGKMYEVLGKDTSYNVQWYTNPNNSECGVFTPKAFHKNKLRHTKKLDTEIKKLNKLMAQLNEIV